MDLATVSSLLVGWSVKVIAPIQNPFITAENLSYFTGDAFCPSCTAVAQAAAA